MNFCFAIILYKLKALEPILDHKRILKSECFNFGTTVHFHHTFTSLNLKFGHLFIYSHLSNVHICMHTIDEKFLLNMDVKTTVNFTSIESFSSKILLCAEYG